MNHAHNLYTTIPSASGRLIFKNALNNASGPDVPESVRYARAWAALEKSGYVENTRGQWVLKDLSDKRKTDTGSSSISMTADFFKADDDKRLVYAWAYVIQQNGEEVVDSHGDTIAENDLIDAAHDYVQHSRKSLEMHGGGKIGEVVESMVFTKDLQSAMSIDLGKVGWFLAIKVHNDSVWQKIKNGELKMLSIGGRAIREQAE